MIPKGYYRKERNRDLVDDITREINDLQDASDRDPKSDGYKNFKEMESILTDIQDRISANDKYFDSLYENGKKD